MPPMAPYGSEVPLQVDNIELPRGPPAKSKSRQLTSVAKRERLTD